MVICIHLRLKKTPQEIYNEGPNRTILMPTPYIDICCAARSAILFKTHAVGIPIIQSKPK